MFSHRRFKLLATASAVAALLVPAAAWAAPTLVAQALSTMAPNSWQRLNLNTFVSVVPQDSQLPIQTFVSPTTKISAWTGAAWDSNRGNLLLWGAAYNGYEGNEVYVWNGNTGLWSRGSLPSQVTPVNANGAMTTVDGVNNAPVSGETYDNLVYLQNVDRLGVVGVSRDGQTWLNQDGSVTGPYFWDPAKANANQVGGITGSQVSPDTFASVVGGQMWQNRNNGDQLNGTWGKQSHGTSDAISVNGKDVVYLTDEFDRLWRYTVSGLDPATDTWELIGKSAITGEAGWGAAAIDTTRGIYLKTVTAGKFGYWNIDSGLSADFNTEVLITPILADSSLTAPDFRNFGVEFDPVQGVFTLWDGSAFVWLLKPPTLLDGSGDWVLERVTVAGAGPEIPAEYTGVYGKWQYLEEEGAFLGVIDPYAGDIFLYKPLGAEPASSGGGLIFSPVPVGGGGVGGGVAVNPTAAVPEPTTMLLVLAAGAVGAGSLRQVRVRARARAQARARAN